MELLGEEWLTNTAKLIISERVEDKRWALIAAPLGRTPQDKKGGRSLSKYGKKLHEMLDQQAPWKKRDKRSRLLKNAAKIEKKIWGKKK